MRGWSKEKILSLIPQQRPMRFVDEILELDEEHILGVYTWKPEDAVEYLGRPLIPPAKLIEMAAQIGNVAWCIYHMSRSVSEEELSRMVGFFAEIRRAECKKLVFPGDKIACFASFGEEGYFRSNKLLSEVQMQFDGGSQDGEDVFEGLLSGMWVLRTE